MIVRAWSPRVVQGKGSLFVFGPQPADACALEGDHAELVLAVLDAASSPVAREDLVRRILEEAGADASLRPAVDTAIDLLLKMGALVTPAREPPPDAAALSGGRILVCVTGAIGAVYAPMLVERLIAARHDVRVAMTRSARRFVRARPFEAITHHPVALGLWEGTAEAPAPHIELARWADAVVIYPCTATTLSRLVAGDCSELVSAVATTTRAPVLLAPSMNIEMLRAPAIADALDRLRERGFFLAYPGMGTEVADAPPERVRRAGVAAPVLHVVRYAGWLLERTLALLPRLLSRAEWEEELARLPPVDAVDEDIARVLREHPKGRLIEVGTGLGAVARAAAREGHTVVATDFARRAVERARSIDPTAPVTWAVDDVTDTGIHGSFDLCVDRGCLGCIPAGRRTRYAQAVASYVQPKGVLVLKVHRSSARQIRAHTFTREEVVELLSPWFEAAKVTESTLSFGEIQAGPALLFEMRRRAVSVATPPP
jgi:hypothetical protein